MADITNLDGSCGCNVTNVRIVCGDFDDPVVPDLGKCAPLRTKRSCEAAVVPVPQCGDTSAYPVYDPDLTPAYRVISKLFDSECDPILDSTGQPILTYST